MKKSIAMAFIVTPFILTTSFALDCNNICPNGLTKITREKLQELRGTFVQTEQTDDGEKGFIEPIDCSLEENNCSDLTCTDFGFVTYMMIKNADLSGSHFAHFGYGENVTSILSSDLRCTQFNSFGFASLKDSLYNDGTKIGHLNLDDSATVEEAQLIYRP